tara:strand:- start:41 stop:898 length:858 start_codon:yes stop_codon:yes gene_type:complete
MDTGNSSSTIPCFDSNFPVDFGLMREPATTSSWLTGVRLTGDKRMFTNTAGSESSDSNVVFDSNVGYFKDLNSARQAWMWKRHAGFDVVTFSHVVDQGDHAISHSLSKTPEMLWLKRRNVNNSAWTVFHKELNGGSNPENYFIELNTTGAEQNQSGIWGSGPTSTHVTLPNNTFGTADYLMILFASTDVSKVGSYTGTGSSHTVTVGFQPRFLFIKRVDDANSWYTINTLQGWGSGDDKYLQLDDTNAVADYDFGAPTSTGFTIPNDSNAVFNANGGKYIYYCHS